MSWLVQNPRYEVVRWADFEFCLLWITSDLIKQLDKWYRIPNIDMSAFRTVLRASWEKDGVYRGLNSSDAVVAFLERWDSANQSTAELLDWFVQTQLSSTNMSCWMHVVSRCAAYKKLDIISPTIGSLYTECIHIPYGDYSAANKEIEHLWMNSPGYRSDWDEYLYKIYYENLAISPIEIASEAVSVLLFREFWHQVTLKISPDSIIEFERKLVRWSVEHRDPMTINDPNLSISASLEIAGFPRT